MIFPISQLSVDWQVYLQTSKEACGESLAQELDSKGIHVGDLKSFLETHQEPSHLFYGFLIVDTKDLFFELLQQRFVTLTLWETLKDNWYLGLSSGTLEEWKSLIIFCGRHNTFSLRKLGNDLQNYFEQKENLWKYFAEFQKVGLSDTSYKLIK